jgi:Holliday junction resolvase
MSRLTPEGKIKEDIREYLERSGFYVRSLVIGAIPGRRNPSAGMPDYIAIRSGRTIWFEVKTEDGRIRKEQVEFITQWTAKGGEAYIVRNVFDVERAVKSRPR